MTSYAQLHEEAVPKYESRDGINLEAQEAGHTVHVAQAYQDRINCCCIAISVLNFLCCSVFGIPALIFAILGIEADKKRDIETAKRHDHYMTIFNIVGCLVFWLYFSGSGLLFFIVLITGTLPTINANGNV